MKINKKGFTLIEIIIAMTIITSVMMLVVKYMMLTNVAVITTTAGIRTDGVIEDAKNSLVCDIRYASTVSLISSNELDVTSNSGINKYTLNNNQFCKNGIMIAVIDSSKSSFTKNNNAIHIVLFFSQTKSIVLDVTQNLTSS